MITVDVPNETTRKKGTLYCCIVKGSSRKAPPLENFIPWINHDPKDQELTLGLAINRFVRNHGGFGIRSRLMYGDPAPLKIAVFWFTDQTEKDPNGEPVSLFVNTYTIYPE